MTEKRSTPATLSASAAKIVLTIASVAGTLGGWFALASGDTVPAEGGPVPSVEPLPQLVEVDPAAANLVQSSPTRSVQTLRRVDQPPAPVTFTRSSR